MWNYVIILLFCFIWIAVDYTSFFIVLFILILLILVKRKLKILKANKIARGILDNFHTMYETTKNPEIKKCFETAVNLFNEGKYKDSTLKVVEIEKIQKRCEYERKKKIEEQKMKRLEREQERKKELEGQKRKKFEQGQKRKGLIQFVTNDGIEKWGKPSQVKKWKTVEVGLNKNFQNISPYEFQDLIANLFIKMGYSARTQRKSGDFGIDVVAEKDDEKIAIQTKRNSEGNLIGNIVIQQTLGAMWKIKANKSIVITTSDFTVMAKEQAKEAPIELWNKQLLHKMIKKYFIDN